MAQMYSLHPVKLSDLQASLEAQRICRPPVCRW
jgi:hypothetical protein